MSIKEEINNKLRLAFAPMNLEVINESHQHSVPQGAETHFKVIIVSENFRGLSLVQRHRAVYEALKIEIASGVHALAIHAMTEEEFSKKQKENFKSPPCLGGSKKD